MTQTPSFRQQVLELVAQIPAGRVMTYGQLALLCGNSKAAREVGYIMHGLLDSGLPWQRVINAQGRVSTGKVGFGDMQRALLEQEGVVFDSAGRCDLNALQWWPDQPQQDALF